MVKTKMNNEYQFEINEKINFEDLNILQETKVILAYLFLNYWGSKEQNERIKQRFRRDLVEEEKIYNSKEIFKKDMKLDIENKELKIIEYKKQSLIKNIINRIKKFLETKRKK